MKVLLIVLAIAGVTAIAYVALGRLGRADLGHEWTEEDEEAFWAEVETRS